MNYPDRIKLATTTSDGYGDKTVTVLDDVSASFIQRSGISHENHADSDTSDAAIYLCPTNATVLSHRKDLEGMYILVEPFADDQWYRISHADFAERKLLDNAIDNVYCKLEKAAGLAYVYIS